MPGNFLRSDADALGVLRRLSLFTAAGMAPGAAVAKVCIGKKFASIADKVGSGASLTEALDPSVFPRSAICMISVGERNGSLSAGLSRACEYMESRSSFRKKFIGALIYPAFVMGMCCITFVISVMFLLPSFNSIFENMGAEAPLVARLSSRMLPLLPGFAVIVAILIYLAVKAFQGDAGYRFPLFGGIKRMHSLAQFFSSLAGSLDAGIGVVPSLELASSTVSGKKTVEGLLNSVRCVSEGEAVASSLARVDVFDDNSIALVSAGESSSSLSRVSRELAVFYEREAENSVKTLLSLMEPAATVATGMAVGLVVMSVFLPMLSLINRMSNM